MSNLFVEPLENVLEATRLCGKKGYLCLPVISNQTSVLCLENHEEEVFFELRVSESMKPFSGVFHIVGWFDNAKGEPMVLGLSESAHSAILIDAYQGAKVKCEADKVVEQSQSNPLVKALIRAVNFDAVNLYFGNNPYSPKAIVFSSPNKDFYIDGVVAKENDSHILFELTHSDELVLIDKKIGQYSQFKNANYAKYQPIFNTK